MLVSVYMFLCQWNIKLLLSQIFRQLENINIVPNLICGTAVERAKAKRVYMYIAVPYFITQYVQGIN